MKGRKPGDDGDVGPAGWLVRVEHLRTSPSSLLETIRLTEPVTSERATTGGVRHGAAAAGPHNRSSQGCGLMWSPIMSGRLRNGPCHCPSGHQTPLATLGIDVRSV